jgi:3-deoxy-D-manno-octulosonic-acid transferase
MDDKRMLSLRAKSEFAAYQSLAGAVALLGAASVPVLERKFARISEGFSHYLGRVPVPANTPSIWVHGVSMGESLVAISFARELKQKFPELPLVFTSTHPDVIKTVRKRKIADVVAYFPLDTVFSMQRAFRRFAPIAVFVAETDFWPAFSYVCQKRNVPLMLINGRISEKIAGFYEKAKGLAEVVFSAFTSFVVQSEADLKRLLRVGVQKNKIKVAGNMKADLTAAAESLDLSAVSTWLEQRKLVVFGSLHPVEFELLKPVFRQLCQKEIAVIIAPRNLKFCQEWASELESEGVSVALKSRVAHSTKLMILDTMGELASVYGLARVAIVGGSLDARVGGHNPLEVIQQNVPLIMGPNNRNFADIVEQLESAEAICICNEADEFLKTIERFVTDDAKANSTALRAKNVLEDNRGALEFTVKLAEDLVKFGLAGAKK